jgi:AMMECR1 domain-containing protein
MSTSDAGDTFDDQLIAYAGRLAVRALETLVERGDSSSEPEGSHPGDDLPPFERVNVTFRCDGRIRGSVSGAGDSFREQIKNAVRRAAEDRRFKGALTRREAGRATLEVWIQTSSAELDVGARLEPGCIALGLEGVEIQRDGHRAYYKPSVAITSGFRTVPKFLAALCKKGGLPKDSWRDPATFIKKTRWIGIFIKRQAPPEPLIFLRRASGVELTREAVATWAEQSCGYFANHQFCNGGIPYIYNPVKDEVSLEKLSRLRACGCLYSLSQATDFTPLSLNSHARDAAVRLARYLINRSRLWDVGHRVIEDEPACPNPRVGSTALMSLALSYPTLRQEFSSVAAEFKASIHRTQKDNGRFITHFGTLHESERQVEFYPGQVLLTLALDVEAGSPRAAEMCEAAFEPYRSHFTTAPKTAFVGWHLDAWSRLAIALDREDYVQFAFQQADWLVKRQITEDSIRENIGGFARSGQYPGYSSIVYIEALVAALRLAAMRNEVERQRRYREAVRLGLTFCARLQLHSVPDAFFQHPSKALGGIAMSHDNLTVRCDFVQHFLTLALKTYENFALIYE